MTNYVLKKMPCFRCNPMKKIQSLCPQWFFILLSFYIYRSLMTLISIEVTCHQEDLDQFDLIRINLFYRIVPRSTKFNIFYPEKPITEQTTLHFLSPFAERQKTTFNKLGLNLFTITLNFDQNVLKFVLKVQKVITISL